MVQAGNLMEGASSRGLAAGALTLFVCVLLVAAAVVDARERRFPTVLGVGLALACAALSLATGGLLRLMWCALVSALTSAVIVAFELWWRRWHKGRAGLAWGTSSSSPRFRFGGPSKPSRRLEAAWCCLP